MKRSGKKLYRFMALLLTGVFAIGMSSAPIKVSAKNKDIASLLKAGGTIPAGHYKLTKGVKVTKDIVANNVVIDASGCPKGTIAITAKASIKGITINYPQRQGISVQSCKGKTLENCTVTHAQFAGIEVKNNVSNITLKNCKSNDNYDDAGQGEDADGFGIKNGAHDITLIKCSANHNSDDGFDCYTSGSNITFKNCTATNNGFGKNGDGNGFKLGPCKYKNQNGGLVTVRNCKAKNNKGWGFLRNHNTVAPIHSGNTATGNKKGQFSW